MPSRRPDSNAMPSSLLRLARIDSSCGSRGPVPGHVACLILVQSGLVELLPALHKAVCAAAWIAAQFGLELKGADRAVKASASSLAGQFRILLVCGFGIMRAIGPHLL